ncbi:hypothetical protein [Vibrio sp. F74]|uniref:hypothetical protein n=1 Tax=Vibrio sp. F74 TaxID=700020 RepID=UPI0035F5DA91
MVEEWASLLPSQSRANWGDSLFKDQRNTPTQLDNILYSGCILEQLIDIECFSITYAYTPTKYTNTPEPFVSKLMFEEKLGLQK